MKPAKSRTKRAKHNDPMAFCKLKRHMAIEAPIIWGCTHCISYRYVANIGIYFRNRLAYGCIGLKVFVDLRSP